MIMKYLHGVKVILVGVKRLIMNNDDILCLV